MARELANAGELAQALRWCDLAISSDSLSPAPRFLRAMVAQELGKLDEAMRAVAQALYLDQEFVMAHYAMGALALRLGRRALSKRHFQTALSLLERLAPDGLVPESEGLTAGRLAATIRSARDGDGGDP
jgi:chemotaxis protein methyltransferase CheR